MSERRILQPGTDHPITVEPAGGTVRVTLHDHVIAESSDALVLKEANYPPVYYLPPDSADQSALIASAHTTHCPYKGDASYYGIDSGGTELADKVWCYRTPYPAVASIADHLAFYPDAVDIEFTPAD